VPAAVNGASFDKSSRLMADTFGEKPAKLVSDPAVQPASVEPTPQAKAGSPAVSPPTNATAESPSRPWLALTVSLFVLFASLGGNVFLGWIAHDARARYGSLLRERRSMAHSSVPA
jgi:hypothetical protein